MIQRQKPIPKFSQKRLAQVDGDWRKLVNLTNAKRKPLNRTSAKKRASDRIRFAVTMPAVRARSGGYCEVRSPVCTGKGQHGHEIVKRSAGGSTTDVENVLDSCDACNSHIEDHPAWAKSNGFSVVNRVPIAPSPLLAFTVGRAQS